MDLKQSLIDCMKPVLITLSAVAVWLMISGLAHAQPIQPASVRIDLDAVAMIESSGCKNKISTRPGDPSYGCHQITPGTLKEYNEMTRHNYSREDLLDDTVSYAVADWYLHKRIPQMIRHFGKPVTVENILISYNAGINYVKTSKALPEVTKKYLDKYRRLAKG